MMEVKESLRGVGGWGCRGERCLLNKRLLAMLKALLNECGQQIQLPPGSEKKNSEQVLVAVRLDGTCDFIF